MAGNAPDLQRSVINLPVIREHYRSDLIKNVLNCSENSKGLVLDSLISGPLALVAEVSMLKANGITSIYHLEAGRLDTECESLIYLARPLVDNMKAVADHVRHHRETGQSKSYHLFFVPRRTMICERVLKEEGVLQALNIGEFHLDLVPFDTDLLSLELEDTYKELYLDNDPTGLYYVARSVMTLQATCGKVPRLVGVGASACKVTQMVERMNDELRDVIDAQAGAGTAPEIDEILFLDRGLDMVTPFLSPLSYEARIDECFGGINNTYVELDAELTKREDGKKQLQALNSKDRIYSDIRDLNISAVGPYLNAKAKFIGKFFEQKSSLQTVSEIRDFAKGLGGAKEEQYSLSLHTAITERILAETRDSPSFHEQLQAEQELVAGINGASDYIEKLIGNREPIAKVLRILIIHCICKNGIKSKQHDFFSQEILQTYGYQYLPTLHKLERLGLFFRSDIKKPASFKEIRKALRLVVDNVNDRNPNDVAYVFSGFAPILARIVEFVLQRKWNSLEELGRMMGVPVRRVNVPVRSSDADDKTKVTLVYFIGGATYSEISAMRYLNDVMEGSRDIVMATTKIVNGSTLLRPLMPKRRRGKK